jgi:hypothetical protein
MNKYIITFREKVFDGTAWLGCMRVDSIRWDITDSVYVAKAGSLRHEFPKSNVRGIVEVKEEGRS